MKSWVIIFMLVSALPALAQQPPTTSKAPLPQLGIAEKVALQSCESSKLDAQRQWQEAQQQENTILNEWKAAHPGYHINQQSFVVDADPPKLVVKPALPAQK